MMGRTFLMELRKSWRGLSIFLIIVLLTAGGFPQFYPAIQQSMDEDLEGAENVQIIIENETVELSWTSYPNVTEYRVLEDNKSMMVTPSMVYQGTENYTEVRYDGDDTQYFAVVGIVNQTGETKLIGMATTSEGGTPFDEMMESSFYRSFTGDRSISMGDITGFISVEFFSWWFLLAGLYVGYISVTSISRDFEEKRMDLIFSTPLSRRNYILEKFAALSVYTLLMVLLAGGIMIASINSLGLDSSVYPGYIMLALLASWPVLLVMQAVGIVTSVYFTDSRQAVGTTLLFAFFQYAFQIISNMASKFSYVNDLGILGYWDYNAILFDHSFGTWDFVGLVVLSALILLVAIILFEKRDIPV